MKALVFMRKYNVFAMTAICDNLMTMQPSLVLDAFIHFNKGSKWHSYVDSRSDLYAQIFHSDEIISEFEQIVEDISIGRQLEKRFQNTFPASLRLLIFRHVYLDRDFNSSFHWDARHFPYKSEHLDIWAMTISLYFFDLFTRENYKLIIEHFTISAVRKICFSVAQFMEIDYRRPAMVKVGSLMYVASSIMDGPNIDNNVIPDESNVEKARELVSRYRGEEKRSINDNIETMPTWLRPHLFGDLKYGFLSLIKQFFLLPVASFAFTKAKALSNFRMVHPYETWRFGFFRYLRKNQNRLVPLWHTNPDDSCSYAVFPLSTIPEESTEIRGCFYTNELALISNIAACLGTSRLLYVKEHLTMNGVRPRFFYKTLNKIPNVRLIAPECNLKQMIRKSYCLYTVGSTSGFEAILMKVPVILFGQAAYENGPGVYFVRGYEDLINANLAALTYHGSDNDILFWLGNIFQQSFEGDIHYFNQQPSSLTEFLSILNYPWISKEIARQLLNSLEADES